MQEKFIERPQDYGESLHGDAAGRVFEVPATLDKNVQPSGGDSPGKKKKKSKQPQEYDKAHSAESAPFSSQLSWKNGNRKAGILAPNAVRNVIVYLENHLLFKNSIVYDEFLKQITITRPMPWDRDEQFKIRGWSDYDTLELKVFFESQEFRLGPSEKTTWAGAYTVARRNPVDPVKEYILNLRWDGKARLEHYLINYCGAVFQPEKYVRAVSANFIKAAVKRTLEPGCPFHHMLVLEGGQRRGKSQTLKALATFNGVSYFTDHLNFGQIGTNFFTESLQGKLIIEFSEMANFKNQEQIKQWITQTGDSVQRKYENLVTEYPRRFVLAASTNEYNWMKDPSGGTRYWPVRVSNQIFPDKIVEENDQIWAEAVYRVVQLGESWYFKPDDEIGKLAEKEQRHRFDEHPWTNIIEEYVKFKEQISTEEIFRSVLDLKVERWGKKEKNELGKIMRLLGFEYSQSRDPDNWRDRQRFWKRIDTSQCPVTDSNKYEETKYEEISFV